MTTPTHSPDRDLARQHHDLHRRRDRAADKARWHHLTRTLQTRLQYARLKVEHGWTKQTLNEVENLYFHHSRSRQPTQMSLKAAERVKEERLKLESSLPEAGSQPSTNLSSLPSTQHSTSAPPPSSQQPANPATLGAQAAQAEPTLSQPQTFDLSALSLPPEIWASLQGALDSGAFASLLPPSTSSSIPPNQPSSSSTAANLEQDQTTPTLGARTSPAVGSFLSPPSRGGTSGPSAPTTPVRNSASTPSYAQGKGVLLGSGMKHTTFTPPRSSLRAQQQQSGSGQAPGSSASSSFSISSYLPSGMPSTTTSPTHIRSSAGTSTGLGGGVLTYDNFWSSLSSSTGAFPSASTSGGSHVLGVGGGGGLSALGGSTTGGVQSGAGGGQRTGAGAGGLVGLGIGSLGLGQPGGGAPAGGT